MIYGTADALLRKLYNACGHGVEIEPVLYGELACYIDSFTRPSDDSTVSPPDWRTEVENSQWFDDVPESDESIDCNTSPYQCSHCFSADPLNHHYGCTNHEDTPETSTAYVHVECPECKRRDELIERKNAKLIDLVKNWPFTYTSKDIAAVAKMQLEEVAPTTVSGHSDAPDTAPMRPVEIVDTSISWRSHRDCLRDHADHLTRLQQQIDAVKELAEEAIAQLTETVKAKHVTDVKKRISTLERRLQPEDTPLDADLDGLYDTYEVRRKINWLLQQFRGGE
ncbi:hypothetical protein HN911_13325 [Candidatus Bathyarchaeota archaeon]|jgi:hypothetical protein|nr:hypothetical protein [Candidatus Bathyarchaeota archaeon]